ncbi:MAG: ribosome silencing factor [Treponema sp.]|nr:ribosome silencing factor [Treponema sp.]
MEDMLPETDVINQADQAEALGALLREHNGQDVSVLDLRTMSDWTDFFIVVTVTSKIHMDGLERCIMEFCREKDIPVLGKSRKTEDDEWRLIDLGSYIVHLMNKRARDFYELERLWQRSQSTNTTNNVT